MDTDPREGRATLRAGSEDALALLRDTGLLLLFLLRREPTDSLLRAVNAALLSMQTEGSMELLIRNAPEARSLKSGERTQSCSFWMLDGT